jgi:hypothetical protein
MVSNVGSQTVRLPTPDRRILESTARLHRAGIRHIPRVLAVRDLRVRTFSKVNPHSRITTGCARGGGDAEFENRARVQRPQTAGSY